MQKYLLIDVETGGLCEKSVSLLTLYGLILDENLEKIDEIDLKIQPLNGRYVVDIQALKVNKIDLLKHHDEAVSMKQATTRLRAFLRKHSELSRKKLIVVGHNVAFDIRFLQNLLPDWDTWCNRRTLDTASLGHALQLLGKMPEENNRSLATLCLYYGIDPSGNHNAKIDVDMTHALLKAMLKALGGLPL